MIPAAANLDLTPPGIPSAPGSAATALETLIQEADRAGVSDVHLQQTANRVEIAFRLDGVLAPRPALESELGERVFGRIKYLAKLKTYMDSIPQDGRIASQDLKVRADVRVATYPTVTGEKIVLRLFQEAELPRLDGLGLKAELKEELGRFLNRAAGLMLLTGPAGSGKSTTIYACLGHLAAQGGRHVITVEDPAERIVPGVMQTEVNEARGLSYATAARHLLRHDPQVMVLGEVRDEETAAVLIRAALTGHLLITTLHAGSCAGVFERLFLLCPDRQAVLSAVELVVNQRLIRRSCSSCHGAGCASCLGTGYRSRLVLAEFVRVTPELREAIKVHGPPAARTEFSLAAEAARCVAEGLTTEAECQRVLGS